MQKNVPKNCFGLAMQKCMVSMATHKAVFKNGDVRTKFSYLINYEGQSKITES